jgi:hypothetical protein
MRLDGGRFVQLSDGPLVWFVKSVGSMAKTRNAKLTNRGIEFANEIAPYVRSNLNTEVETRGVLCSLIARHAKTHHNYAEAACNRSLTPAEERKVDQIETRIRALVAQLETHGQAGDPGRAWQHVGRRGRVWRLRLSSLVPSLWVTAVKPRSTPSSPSPCLSSRSRQPATTSARKTSSVPATEI